MAVASSLSFFSRDHFELPGDKRKKQRRNRQGITRQDKKNRMDSGKRQN
jgi:hypothetical protein